VIIGFDELLIVSIEKVQLAVSSGTGQDSWMSEQNGVQGLRACGPLTLQIASLDPRVS
jgi:hypothetical protein